MSKRSRIFCRASLDSVAATIIEAFVPMVGEDRRAEVEAATETIMAEILPDAEEADRIYSLEADLSSP